MSYDAIGRRYARAIFEIGKEEGNVAALAEQLRSFAESYKGNTELQTVLEHPMVTDEARAAIVLEIAQRVGAGATAQRALKLITRQRRVRAIAEVSRHLDRLVDEDAKVVRAEVLSAGPLIGDRVIDGSLRSRLKGFREAVFS